EVATFRRLIAGPEVEASFSEGRLRMLALELYDISVAVQWRFVSQSALTTSRVAQSVHNELTLRDALGTPYNPIGGTSGATRRDEVLGRKVFEPAVPAEAAWIEATIEELVFRITLV